MVMVIRSRCSERPGNFVWKSVKESFGAIPAELRLRLLLLVSLIPIVAEGAIPDPAVPAASTLSPIPALRNGHVRLSGPSSLAGRLEVFYNGIVGGVCDDRFTDTSAQVVCRYLGLSGGKALCCGAYGPASGPMLLDEVSCRGNETRLDECSHHGWGQTDCGPEEAVGVQCDPAAPPSPSAEGGQSGPGAMSRAELSIAPPLACVFRTPTSPPICDPQQFGIRDVPSALDSFTYRMAWAYPDGSRSCPLWTVVTFNSNLTAQPSFFVQLGPLDPTMETADVSTRPEIVIQRRGPTPAASRVGYTLRDWLVQTWTDVYSFLPSSNQFTLLYDKKQTYDVAEGALTPPGPVVAGWRWKFGSSGTTNGYVPSIFPDLTATASGRGINTTYQLVYKFLDGYYSYPDSNRFLVAHATASTPLTVYVQLVSGVHPTDMAALLLQRVDGESVWNVARLDVGSPEIKSGQLALVFFDSTSQSAWGCPSRDAPPESGPLPTPSPPQGQFEQPPLASPPAYPSNLQEHAPSPPSYPGSALPLPPPSPPQRPRYSCRLALIGWSGTAFDLADLLIPVEGLDDGGMAALASTIFQSASLDCWVGDGSSSDGSAAPVLVEIGALLAPVISHSGIRVAQPDDVQGRPTSQGMSSHWGVAFLDAESVTLVDSALVDLPLSPFGPLVSCWECREFDIHGATFQSLFAPRLPFSGTVYNVHGAVAVTGVLNADFSDFSCVNVRNANGWTCVLLQYLALSSAPWTFSMSNCEVRDSAVAQFVWRASFPFAGGLLSRLQGGFGAITLTTNSSDSDATPPVANARISDSTFTGNVGGSGAALFVGLRPATMESLVICNTTMTRNSAISQSPLGQGGAVYVSTNTARLLIERGSLLDNNMAMFDGGAIYVSGSLANLTLGSGSSISGNSVIRGSGGGVCAALAVANVFILNGSSADRNRASISGLGGFLMSSAAVEQTGDATDVVISGNSSASGNTARRGGVVHMFWLRSFSVSDNSRVDRNTASLYGAVAAGQPANDASDAREVTSILITGQSSLSLNAASGTDVGSAGLIYLPNQHTVRSFQISNGSYVDGNTAAVAPVITFCTSIDSIVVSGNSSLSFNSANQNQEGSEGGGLFYAISIGTLVVEDGGRVASNAIRLAGDGAVLYVRQRVDNVFVRGYGSSVINNTASGGNGGFLGANTLTRLEVSNGGRLIGNTARSSNSGNGGAGGAVIVTASVGSVLISGGEVLNNSATLSGGAFYIAQDVEGDVRLEQGAIVEGNRAETRNGGFLAVGRSIHGQIWLGNGSRVCSCSAAQSGGAVSVQESIHGGLVITSNAAACDNVAVAGDGGAVLAGFAIDLVLISGGGSLENNTATGSGGAIFAGGLLSNVVITSGGHVSGNRAGSDGGAIYSDLISALALSDGGAAAGNAAANDGGFACANRINQLTVYAGRIAGNHAGRSGGAVAVPVPPNSVELSASVISENVAERGTGGALSIAAPQPGSPLLTQTAAMQLHYTISNGTMFYGNGAYMNGGAFSITAEVPSSPTSPRTNKPSINLTVTFENASFVANYAGGAGGAFSLASPAAGSLTTYVTIAYSSFVGNTAGINKFRIESSVLSGYGGAVAMVSTPKFIANAAMKAAKAYTLSGQGGQQAASTDGVSVSLDTACALHVENSAFDNNRCQASGGGIAAVSCPTTILKSNFSSNEAHMSGGGVAGMVEYILSTDIDTSGAAGRRRLQQQGLDNNCSSNGTSSSTNPPEPEWWLDVSSTTFKDNAALLDCGGGLYAEASRGVGSRVRGCTFISNVAKDRNGGGLCIVARGDCAEVQILANDFTNNNASRQGGGIYAQLSDGSGNVLNSSATTLSGNRAAQGGALAVAAALGSRAILENATAIGNSAEQDGGALFAECAMAAAGGTSDVPQACGSEAAVELHSCQLTGNVASKGSGGAMHVGAAASAVVHNTTMTGNIAGSAGGGVAALGCSRLVLVGGSVADGGAIKHGGGVFTHSCERVFLQGLTLEGNRAGTGGGAFFAGPSDDTITVTPISASTEPSVILLEANVARNLASAATADLPVTGGPAEAFASGYRRFGGHGGGVFAFGNVSVLVARSDMAVNNSALVGAALGSAQQCGAPDAAAALLEAFGASVGEAGSRDAAAMADQVKWDLVGALAKSQACWPLLLDEVRLPSRKVLPVWLQDPSATALQARCSGLATSVAPPPRALSGCDSVPSEMLRTCMLTGMLAACAAEPQLEPVIGWNSIGALLEVPPTHMQLESFPGKIRPGTPINVTARLYNGLNLPVQRDTLSFKVAVSIEPLDPSSDARLCSPSPRDTDSDGATCLGSNLLPQPRRPWQDSRIVTLDPSTALGGSLEVTVINGLATWPYLMVRGWPGRYVLVFTANATDDAGLYEVAPLRVEVELLHCQAGEVLDLTWAQQPGAQPSWLTCSRCNRGRFTFWRDSRPSLWEIDVDNYTGYIQDWANRAVEEEATCMPCPNRASCLGGALVIPDGGYWHSAHDSALFHRCPGKDACGRSVDASDGWASMPPTLPGDLQVELLEDGSIVLFDANSNSSIATDDQSLAASAAASTMLLPSVTTGLDARAGWLALCQQVWYVVLAGTDGRIDTRLPDGLPSDPSSIVELVAACETAGVIRYGRDTGPYQQLECARGYTGRLCAACLPGYYINSEFECRSCPQRNLVFAILAFIGSVVLVLFMALMSFKEGRESTPPPVVAEHLNEESGNLELAKKEEEVPFSEFLKVAIVHAQFYIIITRLPVAYPDVISQTQATLSAVTGAENTVAWSYSCFYAGQASDGQARAQLLGALIVPALVVATSLLIWVLRYHIVNTGCLTRLRYCSKPKRADKTDKARQLGFGTMAAAVVDAPSLTPATSSGDSRALSPSPFMLAAPVLSPCASVEQDKPEGSPRRDGSGHPRSKQEHPSTKQMQTERLSSTSLVSAQYAVAASSSLRGHLTSQRPSGMRRSLTRLQRVVSVSLKDVKETIVQLDKKLNIWRQLGIVSMVAVFILYPGWAQAALSVFSCYRIDDGHHGPFADRQQATWRFGYWVRDMQQECYSGTHLQLYLPIGVVSVLLVCLMPPLTSFVLLWSNRNALDDPGVQQRYGFLYSRYKRRYFWWESVLMLEELGLVAVEVFGRALPAVSHHVLLMLAAFIVLSTVNMSCAPVRSRLISLLEFLSLCVLSLTVTLSLYFVVDLDLAIATANIIGLLIIFINLALLAGFLALVICRYWIQIQAASATARVWLATCTSCLSGRKRHGSTQGEAEYGTAGYAIGSPDGTWMNQAYGHDVIALNASLTGHADGNVFKEGPDKGSANAAPYYGNAIPTALAQVTLGLEEDPYDEGRRARKYEVPLD